MISSVAFSLAFAAVTAAAGPCDLLDRAAAGALLGAPVTKMEPSGPEPDEDSGGSRTTCTYQAGQAMLIVIRLEEFDYAGAAALGVVMLSISFVMLLAINLLQVWGRKRLMVAR